MDVRQCGDVRDTGLSEQGWVRTGGATGGGTTGHGEGGACEQGVQLSLWELRASERQQDACRW